MKKTIRKTLFSLMLVCLLIAQTLSICANPISVDAAKNGKKAGVISAGNTYTVTVKEKPAGLIFVPDKTGWYSFKVSELKEIGVKSSKDTSSGLFMVADKREIKIMVDSDYEDLQYEGFDPIYLGKKRIKNTFHFGFMDISSKHQCKIDNKKENDPQLMSYTINEGKVKLKKGKEYAFMAFIVNKKKIIRKGWIYKLSIKKC